MDCNKRFDEINKKISEYFSSVIKFASIIFKPKLSIFLFYVFITLLFIFFSQIFLQKLNCAASVEFFLRTLIALDAEVVDQDINRTKLVLKYYKL